MLFPNLLGTVYLWPLRKLGREFSSLLSVDSKDSAIILGDSARALARLPDGVFQSCITSPPYWSLRDYGIPGQIGLEPSVTAYINALVEVFEQVRRVLRAD